MSIFVKPSSVAGRRFFKPKEAVEGGAVAILVEPKSVEKDVPNTYKGVTNNRDEVTATITIFDAAGLASGTPTEVIENGILTHGMLTRAAQRALGGAMVARLEMIETQRGEGWAFQDVTPEVEGQVGAYYEKREAALAAAVASAPGDF